MDLIINEKFWLPVNVSWKDFENPPPGIFYPTIKSLKYLPIYTGLLLVVRYLLETLIFKPIGRWIGFKEKPVKRVRSNRALDEVYRTNKRPSHQLVKELSDVTGWTIRQIDLWFRQRRNMDKFPLLIKWSESGWRFSFYLSAGIYGVCVLWNKPWLLDQRKCWEGYPWQHMGDELYWYYMLELSFYCSAVISIFIEVKRKDFWEMFIHHIATILLVSFSYMTNFARIGALIFLVHDIADPWMEAAKLAKYCKHEALSIGIFVVFMITWIVTRLYFYPAWLLKSVIYDTIDILKPWPALYVFWALLSLLQVLHIIWTYLILQIPYRLLVLSTELNDSRSDSEMESFSGDENGNSLSAVPNGTRTKID